MITMLGLFIVVTYVEQRLIVLPNTAGKKELYGSNPCFQICDPLPIGPRGSILPQNLLKTPCSQNF